MEPWGIVYGVEFFGIPLLLVYLILLAFVPRTRRWQASLWFFVVVIAIGGLAAIIMTIASTDETRLRELGELGGGLVLISTFGFVAVGLTFAILRALTKSH